MQIAANDKILEDLIQMVRLETTKRNVINNSACFRKSWKQLLNFGMFPLHLDVFYTNPTISPVLSQRMFPPLVLRSPCSFPPVLCLHRAFFPHCDFFLAISLRRINDIHYHFMSLPLVIFLWVNVFVWGIVLVLCWTPSLLHCRDRHPSDMSVRLWLGLVSVAF